MPRRVAYLAEQNCRKSAEARLDTELRKVYKLQARNQEIAHTNARLQQQLRASKNEVQLLMVLDLGQPGCSDEIHRCHAEIINECTSFGPVHAVRAGFTGSAD